MTDPTPEPQSYWYIKVPRNKNPKPKFHIDQQIGSYWEDEFANLHCDIGVIIGMQYGASDYNRSEWSYLIRWLKCDSSPKLIGLDDRRFDHESNLVVDNTDIERPW